MPQLKCDEWPDDGEGTTTEQESSATPPATAPDDDTACVQHPEWCAVRLWAVEPRPLDVGSN